MWAHRHLAGGCGCACACACVFATTVRWMTNVSLATWMVKTMHKDFTRMVLKLFGGVAGWWMMVSSCRLADNGGNGAAAEVINGQFWILELVTNHEVLPRAMPLMVMQMQNPLSDPWWGFYSSRTLGNLERQRQRLCPRPPTQRRQLFFNEIGHLRTPCQALSICLFLILGWLCCLVPCPFSHAHEKTSFPPKLDWPLTTYSMAIRAKMVIDISRLLEGFLVIQGCELLPFGLFWLSYWLKCPNYESLWCYIRIYKSAHVKILTGFDESFLLNSMFSVIFWGQSYVKHLGKILVSIRQMGNFNIRVFREHLK